METNKKTNSLLLLQLNQRTSSNTGTTQDLSFLKGASPIYLTSLSGNNVTPTTDVSHHTITTTSEANNNIAAVKSTSSSPSRTFENKSNQANSRVIIGKTANSVDTNSIESKGTVFNGNIPNNSHIHSSSSAEKGVSSHCKYAPQN